MMPIGLRFNPTDEEIIEILQRKVYGQQMPFHGHFIFDINIYEFDPQDLQWDHITAICNNERYWYHLRENECREVLGRGWWRATGHIKKINSNEKVVGYKRPLTFYRFTHNDRDRNKAIKTNWIMHEYCLESKTSEWRLCKIRYNERRSVQNDNTSRNTSEASRSSILGMQPSYVGEQSQPRPLQLSNVTDPYFEPFQQVCFDGEQQLQSQTFLLDNVYDEPYFTESMQMEMIDEQQHQPQASSYRPTYYSDDLLEQPPNSLEQPFPGLWSWKN